MSESRSGMPENNVGSSSAQIGAAPAMLSPARCVHHWFEWQAKNRPHSIAISDSDSQLSFRQLNEKANSIAQELIDAGVVADDLVGLCIGRNCDLLAGLFGILKAGAAYVPLDPDYPLTRLEHMLKQAQPKIILSQEAVATNLPQNSAELLLLDNISSDTPNNPEVEVSGDNLCYVIFTSGSTGLPKGVMVTHENVVRLFETIGKTIDFRSDDIWTLFHSCAFGFSAWEMFGSLLHGSQLVIVADDIRKDPQALYNLLRETGTSVFSQTPSAFRQLLLGESFANSNTELKLRRIIFSGEAVVPEDLQRWNDAHGNDGPELINTYAITETGGQVAVRIYNTAADSENSSGNVGMPLADSPIFILDEDLQAVAEGCPGELCVGGPGVARGYLNQAELTAQSFINLPDASRVYRTGDQAVLLASGELKFIGRKDRQVKLRGYRIELGEIETIIRQLEPVRETAVILRKDSGSEPRLVAYLACDTEAPSVSELRDHITANLPEYMVPAAYVNLKELPLNPNGKLDRSALPLPGNDRPHIGTDYVAPANPLETDFAEIWATALGVRPVGCNDNFFELGGDSILALKLTSQLRELLNDYIYISALIEAPTIRELISYLSQHHGAAVKAYKSGDTLADGFSESLPPAVPDLANLHEVFPLTDIQQAYLVGRGSDFALGGVATHLYIEVDAADLDLPRFEAAWQKVIDRHSMLRAIVLPDGTQQILADVPPYKIPTQDLSLQDSDTTERGLQNTRDRMSHQVLPSDVWPLFELSATVIDEQTTRLHISLDCLITDARSFQIMSAELLQFYQDGDLDLPVPQISFRDYVIAEHKLNESAFYQRAMDYWKQRLETLPKMPQLPLAIAPEKLQDHKFVQRGFQLPKEDWERFQNRASQAGITPTAALLQVFGETLATWSRQPRLTLNLTLFNRMPLHDDVDDVVGDFTSLVLLGIDNLESDGFEARAQRLQKELWQGVDNRFVSGVRVLREMAQIGDGAQIMMPIVFTSTLGIGSGGEDSSSWHHFGEQVFAVSQTPQVWLDHVASERDGGLWATWDAVEALFPADMLDEMFASYCDYIRRLATDENAWQLDWNTTIRNLVPPTQRAMVTDANNTSGPVPDGLLHAGFVEQASRRPDAPAIISNDRCLTYGELDELSNQLAHRLSEHNVKPDELVAVVMQKGWEQVVAVLGILKAGAAYLPVDATMPTERLHYLLEYGEARIAVTQGCQDAAIEWPEATTRIRINEADLGTASTAAITCPASQLNLAYVIFTSGSTGQPKGVVIDHRGAANTCADINDRFAVTANDSVLALSSLSFDLSVYDIFGVLAAGGQMVFPDANGLRDPSHWAELVLSNQISLWNTVPALMDLVTDFAEQQTESPIRSLRVSMMSGDWIPVKLPKRIETQCNPVEVISMGGATEASIWSIIYPVKDVPDDWVSIPYGKAMRNQSFHVLNTELEMCPVWVPGELYIGGIGVAKGYWRDAEKTAASFITHPRTGETLYKTGDLGRLLPDGNIEFMGREDFQVKVQGFRVELGDIEAALESHSNIRSCVVTAVGPSQGNKRLVAYMVAEGTAPEAAGIRDYLADKLPEYMIPAAYMFLETLPLTDNGKVDRRALPEPDLSETKSVTTTPAVSGNDDIAKHVTEVLGMTEIDAAENLLQMGATSIEMIRIANALDQNLSFRPRMDDFYRDPSVNGLTALYLQQQPGGAANSVEALDDPLLTHPSVLKDVTPITDPDDRANFKATLPGIRSFDSSSNVTELPDTYALDESQYLAQRSYRQFSPEAMSLENFSLFLSHLRARQINERPKYLYGSAGGLYPIQTYVYVKPSRIDGLKEGIYYFDPMHNRLNMLSEDPGTMRDLYDPIINRPVFDQAAFSIFFVAEMQAIGSMYSERSLHYSVIETGHMTQLLEAAAPGIDIGLCQIGGLETKYFVDLLKLNKTHILLHALVGGSIDHSLDQAATAPVVDTDDDRDEGEI
ncbi:MAG: amino acid adenylation domain-containing protein [Gammaproteobacteria bacterium]|nr:amino acid adenylation domain-containing protein [Gammaproteobacteria bacterium]